MPKDNILIAEYWTDLPPNRTTTLSGRVFDNPPGASIDYRNGATVVIAVEGREAARTVSRTIGGNVGSCSITFDHPGAFRVTASFEGRSHSLEFAGVRDRTRSYHFDLN